jgi:G:T-mismatch repair DNA endonuclease (very short patch repair protein)
MTWITKRNTIYAIVDTIDDISNIIAKRTKNYKNNIHHFINTDEIKEFAENILKRDQISLYNFNREFSSFFKQKYGEKYNYRRVFYWIVRGYSYDESVKKIKKLQTELSKKSRIPELIKQRVETWYKNGHHKNQSRGRDFYRQKGFSEEEVENKIKERNIKWANSLSKAIEIDPTIIHRRVIYRGPSAMEKKLGEILGEEYTPQYVLTDENKMFIYDFINHKKKILIEFNGDFWHCNPKKFTKDYIHPVINLSAEEIWKKDNRKKIFAEEKGYRVVVIWEDDFTKWNPTIIKTKINNIIENNETN